MFVLFPFAETSVSPFLPGASDGNACSLLILSQAVSGFLWESISREQQQLEPVRGFRLLLIASSGHPCTVIPATSQYSVQPWFRSGSVSANTSLSLFLFPPKASYRNTDWLQCFYMRQEMHCYRAFSNLIYSTANTLVTVCNKLLVKTTVSCTYNAGENSFCL